MRSCLTILFSPGGRLEGLYDGATAAQPLGTLYLMIGKREKAITPIPIGPPAGPLGDPSASDGAVFNYQDLTNLWVTIGPQTGLIAVGENANWLDKDDDGIRDDDKTDPAKDEVLGSDDLAASDSTNDIPIARAIAQQAQSMGGR